MTSWSDLRDEFRRYVLQRGERTLEDVAREIPASRTTVYYLMVGKIQRPSHAVRQGVERIVEMFKVDRSDDDTSG